MSEVDAVLSRVKAALIARDLVKSELGWIPHVRITASNLVKLDAEMRGELRIRELVRLLRTDARKTVSIQGFLQYVLETPEYIMVVHTRECFYGGEPRVERHPRTRAVCPIPGKEAESGEA